MSGRTATSEVRRSGPHGEEPSGDDQCHLVEQPDDAMRVCSGRVLFRVINGHAPADATAFADSRCEHAGESLPAEAVGFPGSPGNALRCEPPGIEYVEVYVEPP